MTYFISFLLLKCLLVNSLNLESKSSISKVYETKKGTINISISLKGEGRFYYIDEFDNDVILYLSENKISLSQPFLEIIDGKTNVSYILHDGESVAILFEKDKIFFEIKDHVRKIELNYPSENQIKFENSFLNIPVSKRAIFEQKYLNQTALRDSILLNDFNLELLFLRKYQKDNRLNQQFFDTYYASLKYKYLANYLFAGGFDFPKAYIDYLIYDTKKELNKDGYLYLKNYRSFLRIFLMVSKIINSSTNYKSLIDQNYSGQSKNFIRSILILNSLKQSPFFSVNETENNQLIDVYLKECKSPENCEYISKTVFLSNLNLHDDEVINVHFKEKNLKEMANGKITYVDFWASWCGPCIAEMPNSKKLKSEYEKKGVNFVFISIDEDYDAWMKGNHRINLTDSESFLLPKGFKSNIAKKFNIEAVPRYMILDKNGVVLNSDAPRPSDPKVKVLFDTLRDGN